MFRNTSTCSGNYTVNHFLNFPFKENSFLRAETGICAALLAHSLSESSAVGRQYTDRHLNALPIGHIRTGVWCISEVSFWCCALFGVPTFIYLLFSTEAIIIVFLLCAFWVCYSKVFICPFILILFFE